MPGVAVSRACGWGLVRGGTSGSCPDACPFLYACISRLSDSVVVQNKESYTAFSLVAPAILYPMHTETMKNTYALFLPFTCPLRSTAINFTSGRTRPVRRSL